MKSSRFASLVAALSLTLAGAVQAAGYTGLYIFGDSLSDSGNNAAVGAYDPAQLITSNLYYGRQTYASGTYSNGAVWSQQFAGLLGLQAQPSLGGGGNYAFGGAQTSTPGNETPEGFPFSMTMQLDMFRADLLTSGHAADPNALYVVAGGGNNVRVALESAPGSVDPFAFAAAYAADIGTIIDGLQAAGAQHIIVWNAPNFGLTPLANALGSEAVEAATGLSVLMNLALNQRLSFEGPGVQLFDVFGLMSSLFAPGASTSFTNLTDACGNTALACNADLDTALFWDAIHPTTAGHAFLANGMLALAVPEPASIALMLAGLGLVAGLARRRAACEASVV